MQISEEHLHDEQAAREYLEAIRWPDGPVCPHCGVVGKVYRLPTRQGKRQVIKCGSCRRQFSVTVGTIFEDSHIPLHKWLYAFHLYASSKKGFSAHQLHRTLEISYKSAWFMAHRIRHCMRHGPLKEKLSGIVEADEAYIGGRERGLQHGIAATGKSRIARRLGNKTPVVSLVERGGKVRSFVTHRVTSENLKRILSENIDPSARLMTDQYNPYKQAGKLFASHEAVDHSRQEYVRGDVTTNTVEGFFSILKRGINGVYHHVGRQHLHRYLSEFDFRYNHRSRLGIEDDERAQIALKQIEGRRLQYRDPVGHGDIAPDSLR